MIDKQDSSASTGTSQSPLDVEAGLATRTEPARNRSAEQKPADTETNIEQRMSAFERSTLRWTQMTFAVTLATGLFIGLQWHEMHSGSRDTHDLAMAAKAQADASKSQSDLISKEVDALRQAAGAQSKIASATQAQVDAVSKQMRQDQRPWIQIDLSAPEVQDQKPIEGILKFTIMGKTPARDVSVRGVVEVVQNGGIPKLLFGDNICGNVGVRGVMYPGQSDQMPVFSCHLTSARPLQSEPSTVSSAQFREFTDGKIFFVIYAKIVYYDVFGVDHWTNACKWFYSIPSKARSFSARACTEFNRVDHN